MTADLFTGLPPVEGMARIYCHCGCGVWFYVPRKKGRRRLYVNAEHWHREKWRRERLANGGMHHATRKRLETTA